LKLPERTIRRISRVNYATLTDGCKIGLIDSCSSEISEYFR
jgi:hypothetical protein